ncbi:hypothetical protein GW932_05060 [archaeon]|nr:hypothetical protein [archaeon]
MKTIICEKIARIIKNKKKLEKTLEVKITNRGREVTIEGSPENEFTAEQVIDALNFGFPYSEAIYIKTEGRLMEVVNIKDYTNKPNLSSIRARVIGKGGKALKTLSSLTDCAMELKENKIAIIGLPEDLERGTEALIGIIKGAKHGAVYNELEKNMPKPIYDLGLKNEREPVTMEEFEKRLQNSEDEE